MAKIDLENMEFYAFHGCYAQEQLVGNRFRVDINFEYNSDRAQQSDSITDAISYLDIYEITSEQMRIKSHLLEHLCKRIISEIKKCYNNIENISVKVTKLAPPLGGTLTGVSATVTE